MGCRALNWGVGGWEVSGFTSRTGGRIMEQRNHNLLLMQPILSIPPGKCPGDIDPLSLALPLNQSGHRRPPGGVLELVTKIVVIGGILTQHGGAMGQRALNLTMVDGTGKVGGRNDGRAGSVGLFLDGERQARGAAEM